MITSRRNSKTKKKIQSQIIVHFQWIDSIVSLIFVQFSIQNQRWKAKKVSVVPRLLDMTLLERPVPLLGRLRYVKRVFTKSFISPFPFFFSDVKTWRTFFPLTKRKSCFFFLPTHPKHPCQGPLTK